MRKLFFFAAALICAAVFSGCTTYYKDVAGDYQVNPQSQWVSPYYTEYEIGQKRVEGRGEATVLFGVLHFGENKFCQIGSNPNITFLDALAMILSPSTKAISNAKASSLYDICESNQADFLVGTTFQYTVTNALIVTTVKCKTTAFPAQVKEISIAKPIILNKDQEIRFVNPRVEIKDYSKPKGLIVESGK